MGYLWRMAIRDGVNELSRYGDALAEPAHLPRPFGLFVRPAKISWDGSHALLGEGRAADVLNGGKTKADSPFTPSLWAVMLVDTGVFACEG